MTAYLACPTPRAFAHRGWHTGDLTGCENSLAAFIRALDEGYTYLETDVHLTADGKLIAFHDHHLDRVTDGHGVISQLPWSTVSQSLIGGRKPIPLFAQVLELLQTHPNARLNIDPKTDATVGPLLDAIQSSGVADRVCIGSFSDARLKTISAALGHSVATSLGPRGVAGLAAAASLGGNKQYRRRGSAVAAQVPVRYGRIPVVTPKFLAAAHRSGLEVHVWTINDPTEMHRLLDLGVDGIMTDCPDLLRKVLTDRGAWS